MVGPYEYVSRQQAKDIIYGIIFDYIDYGGIIRPKNSPFGTEYKLKIEPLNPEEQDEQ